MHVQCWENSDCAQLEYAFGMSESLNLCMHVQCWENSDCAQLESASGVSEFMCSYLCVHVQC